jgi:hypothetical protein
MCKELMIVYKGLFQVTSFRLPGTGFRLPGNTGQRLIMSYDFQCR